MVRTMVNVYVPVATEESMVPLIRPVLDSVNPVGKVEPVARLHEKGPPAPVAVKVCWYAAFCVAMGRVGSVAIAIEVAATPFALRLAP